MHCDTHITISISALQVVQCREPFSPSVLLKGLVQCSLHFLPSTMLSPGRWREGPMPTQLLGILNYMFQNYKTFLYFFLYLACDDNVYILVRDIFCNCSVLFCLVHKDKHGLCLASTAIYLPVI